MLKPGVFLMVVPLWVAAGACGSSPTTPAPAGNNAGQWSGTTSQGRPIAFTVSADEKVTSIIVGYTFNGCSGTHTFSNLNVETAPNVTCIPGPCSPTISSYRAFHYAAGTLEDGMTSINGLFLPGARAEGAVGFANYPACGSALGVAWTATRR